jgi:L-histidine N-alpha-methyltransferase
MKALPSVWLRRAGSQLYGRSAQLPDYFPGRESEILSARADAVARRIQANTLVELGAGTAMNTRLLLNALEAVGTLERFVPLDVNEPTLRASAQEIGAAYPQISVHAIVGDFERDLGALPTNGRLLMAFLGSTIGNLYPEQRKRFFEAVATALGREDALLVGIDLGRTPREWRPRTTTAVV